MRYNDISEHRTDLSPDEEYLQISGRKLKKGLKVKAHKHISIENVVRLTTKTDITQEAWVVFEGCIKGTFYDLDDSVLYELKTRHSQLQDMMINYIKTHDYDHMAMFEYDEKSLSGIIKTINDDILTRGYIDTVYIENIYFN